MLAFQYLRKKYRQIDMEAITEPYVESETPQEEEVVETKVKTNDGRGKNPNSMANLKPRAKKSPDAPKVRYAVKQPPGDTMIYDMASAPPPPPETPKKKKRRTKVVVVEQDSSDEDSDQDIQVVVAKKQKKKPTPPVPSAPKRPATPAPTPREESDDELEVKPAKPIIKAPPRPTINFF
jgi:hypothetical protein